MGAATCLRGNKPWVACCIYIIFKDVFRPIRDIAEKYNIMQNAMASAERIFLILDNQERIPQAVNDSGDKTPVLTK